MIVSWDEFKDAHFFGSGNFFCWGAKRIYGSLWAFYIGSPSLITHEASQSRNRRRLYVVGEIEIRIMYCAWQVKDCKGNEICNSDSIQSYIDEKIEILNGQKVINIEFKNRDYIIYFEYGEKLRISGGDGYDDGDELWAFKKIDGDLLLFYRNGNIEYLRIEDESRSIVENR